MGVVWVVSDRADSVALSFALCSERAVLTHDSSPYSTLVWSRVQRRERGGGTPDSSLSAYVLASRSLAGRAKAHLLVGFQKIPSGFDPSLLLISDAT